MKKFTDKINESDLGNMNYYDKTMLSAEDLFEKYSSLCSFEEGPSEYLVDKEDFIAAMIEFAKMHVKEALRVASLDAEIEDCGNPYDPSDDSKCINTKSVINCYNLDSIK